MKRPLIGACLAAALAMALPAGAQQSDLSGTWGFHTADYAPQDAFTLTMSGVASMRRAQNNRYEIDLMTQEVATRGDQFLEIWSRQRCTGRAEGEALTVTCELVEAGQEGYQADNFQLTRQADGALSGHLVSSTSSPVIFRRLR